MSGPELCLAAALLCAPVDAPEPVPSEAAWPAVRDAVHALALEWQVMDPRETRYVFAHRADFAADLNLLRKRVAELADAPKLEACKWLPERRAVNELVRQNRDYRCELEARRPWELDRADLFHDALREVDRLYRPWDALRDAQCDFYYVTVRRTALKKVRDAIGADAFAAGRMPAAVPAR
jgi:hypothetical protein